MLLFRDKENEAQISSISCPHISQLLLLVDLNLDFPSMRAATLTSQVASDFRVSKEDAFTKQDKTGIKIPRCPITGGLVALIFWSEQRDLLASGIIPFSSLRTSVVCYLWGACLIIWECALLHALKEEATVMMWKQKSRFQCPASSSLTLIVSPLKQPDTKILQKGSSTERGPYILLKGSNWVLLGADKYILNSNSTNSLIL